MSQPALIDETPGWPDGGPRYVVSELTRGAVVHDRAYAHRTIRVFRGRYGIEDAGYLAARLNHADRREELEAA